MSDPYAEIKTHFTTVEGVTVNAGRGAQGLKWGKKMFVMFYKGQLIVTLPPERVSELISSGQGLPFDPGTGKPMKDRLLVPESSSKLWIEFCEESRSYVSSKQSP
jgi:hypothetical protein